jgi:hypothetical protein
MTPKGQFGPDPYNTSTHEWLDVTTQKAWKAHVRKYKKNYGHGEGLLY